MSGLVRLTLCILLVGLLCTGSFAAGQQLRPGSGWLVQGGAYPGSLWKTPVRVLLAGDSLMESLGPQLRSSLAGYGNITFIPIGKKSTGLSRPDFYDWPAVLKQHLAADRPHLVVMWVGTNDPQGIYGYKGLGAPCSEAWQQVYRSKVREIISLAHSHGARILFMGPPVVGDYSLNAQLGVIDRLMQQECSRLGVCYVSTRFILGDSRGIFHSQGRLLDGSLVTIRSRDRVHITSDGNRRVMDYLLPYLGREIERCFRVSAASASAAKKMSGSAAVIRPSASAGGKKPR